ncbi:MAG: DUF1499 domain-containing protein [Pseudomonadota bacterium]|nr:DUF1499 domain-containing protein [Pseudomonadota bacterium]
MYYRQIVYFFLLIQLSGCAYNYQDIDWKNPPKPNTNNYFYICADGFCDQNAQIAKSYAISTDVLYQIIQDVIMKQPRTELVKQDTHNKTMVIVQRTPWLKFPDVIQIQVISTESEQASYLWYSKAVYGYYDFEVNKKRLLDWQTLVDQEVQIYLNTNLK